MNVKCALWPFEFLLKTKSCGLYALVGRRLTLDIGVGWREDVGYARRWTF